MEEKIDFEKLCAAYRAYAEDAQHFEVQSGRAFFALARALQEYLNAPETWVDPETKHPNKTVRVYQKGANGANEMAKSPFEMRDFDDEGAVHGSIGLAVSHQPNSFPKHYFIQPLKIRVFHDQIKVDFLKGESLQESSASFVLSPDGADWTEPAKKMAENVLKSLTTSAFEPWTDRNSGKIGFL
jgi:hypothetical protein